MYGGVGSDTVNGNGGNDAVYGGRGKDAVNGGPGDDLLEGNAGEDTISGDTGGDVIQAVDDQRDQINCAGGTDEIYFDRGLDVLRRCEVRHTLATMSNTKYTPFEVCNLTHKSGSVPACRSGQRPRSASRK